MLAKIKSLFDKKDESKQKTLAIEALDEWLLYLHEFNEYNPCPDQTLKCMYRKSSLEKASEVVRMCYLGDSSVTTHTITIMHFLIDMQRLLIEKKPIPIRFLEEQALKSYKLLTGNEWERS